MFAFLLACSGSSSIQIEAASGVDDSVDDTDTLAADVSCPAVAGLVDGRTWTYDGDTVADDAGAVVSLTRTVTAGEGGVYTIAEDMTQTFSAGVVTTVGTVVWRCEGGALMIVSQEYDVEQSYGSTFAYSWSFEPAAVLWPADAAAGATWESESVASYWYDNGTRQESTSDYVLLNTVRETTESLGAGWDSLVVDTTVSFYDGDTLQSEYDYARGWATDVGLTADGNQLVELIAVE